MILFLVVLAAVTVWWLFWWGFDRACHKAGVEWRKWIQAQGATAQKITRAGDFVNRNAYLAKRALIILWIVAYVVWVASTYETPAKLYH